MPELAHPLASDDAVTRVMHGQPVDSVPVALAYETLGSLQYYRVARSWNAWRRRVEAAGGEALRLTYDLYLQHEVELQAEVLRDIYLRPAWWNLPHNLTPEQVEGARIVRRGADLYWVSPAGEETRIRPTLEGQELDYAAGYRDLWERGQGADPLDRLLAERTAPVPEPTDAEVEAIAQSPSYDVARRLAAEFPDALPFYTAVSTPYNSFAMGLGFQTAMTALVERPEAVQAVLGRWVPQPTPRLLGERKLGVSLLHVEECLASADILSPRMYQDFSQQFTVPSLELWEGLGYRTMLYFSGNLMPLLPYLRELPFTALCCEEDRKGYGIDLGKVRRALGPDRVLFGNLDASFVEQASDEEVLAEVRRQISVAGSRNFILSLGSPLTPRTTLERVRLVTEATRGVR